MPASLAAVHSIVPMPNTELSELPDADLISLHREGRRTLEHGDPLSEGVRVYGIRDPGALREWMKEVERELDARGLDYRPLPPGASGDELV